MDYLVVAVVCQTGKYYIWYIVYVPVLLARYGYRYLFIGLFENFKVGKGEPHLDIDCVNLAVSTQL